MAKKYRIHPGIGVARVGNSPNEFYLAPEEIGGLPLECDQCGNSIATRNGPSKVHAFKDGEGRMKRQAARFKIFEYDEDNPQVPLREITLNSPDIKGMQWRVHLANKKSSWYCFSELEGNRLLGKESPTGNSNSYAARKVPLRNASVTDRELRQKLIIDPGPRVIAGCKQKVEIDRDSVPPDYKYGSFPGKATQGTQITSLGRLHTDDEGRLVVLGGLGYTGGAQPISSFGGADTWHDDISDGPVSCTLLLENEESIELDAWVIVCAPKVAPELVNIVTLDDLLFDLAVRYQGLDPGLYNDGWNHDYIVSFEQHIEPLFRRPLDYAWVAWVPTMMAFAAPKFDPRDASESNRKNREEFFKLFRRPEWTEDSQQNQLASGPGELGVPLMPMNAGSNCVWQRPGTGIRETLVEKFLTLTITQHFLLGQWAAGKFKCGKRSTHAYLHALDHASVSNCVGSPMCPGIEVTWSVRSPCIYSEPYRIRHRYPIDAYKNRGLSLQGYDETDEHNTRPGCEPGDLTKRMAVPWQADFFQCAVQMVNFGTTNVNQDANHIPLPPTYYTQWWPPQSPVWVLSGAFTDREQFLSGAPAGTPCYYTRGINSFTEMLLAWSYVGFITNRNQSDSARTYPHFVETERNHDKFQVSTVALGKYSDFMTGDNSNFIPMWHLKETESHQSQHGMSAGTPWVSPRARRRDHHAG